MSKWLIWLIIVSLLISVAGFVSSLVMNNGISRMQEELVTVDRMKNDILTYVTLERIEFSDYITAGSGGKNGMGEKLEEAARTCVKAADIIRSKEVIVKLQSIKEMLNKDIRLTEKLTASSGAEYTSIVTAKLSMEKEIFMEIVKVSSTIRIAVDRQLIEISFTAKLFYLLMLSVFILVTGGAALAAAKYFGKEKPELEFLIGRAVVDRETELYNSKYFEERLFELTEKAARFKDAVAVALISPDTSGISLKETGEAVKKQLRTYDLLARYNNSVAVILYKVTRKNADKVLKRLITTEALSGAKYKLVVFPKDSAKLEGLIKKLKS